MIMLPMYEIRKTELSVKRNMYSLTFPEHMHKYIEIIYAAKGSQKVTVAGTEYTVMSGAALVILPDVIHSYAAGDYGENEIVIIIAEPKLFGALIPDLRNAALSEPLILPECVPDGLRTALMMISPEQTLEIQLSWACVAVSYVMNIIRTEFTRGAPIEDMSFKIIRYMEENFTEDISRRSIARHFGLSECYVSKIFSGRLRMDIRNYLGLIRVEYAARLIRSSDESLDAVARLSGFGSVRTFDRTFKAVYGMTPGEYKRSINRFIKGTAD